MSDTRIIGFAGWSGSGKTTLIEGLIPLLRQSGLRVAVIKHDVHGICADETGKDSQRFRQAGAQCVLCGKDDTLEWGFTWVKDADLILVEGFKRAKLVQIGIARKANGKGFTKPLEEYLAVATDMEIENCPVPCFDLNDREGIAAFIVKIMEQLPTKA